MLVLAVVGVAASLQSATAQQLQRRLPTSANEVRSNAMSAQLHRAEIAYKSGASLLEAKVRLDRVLKEHPNDVQALKLRSKVLTSMGRHVDAFADARRAAASDPRDGEANLLVALGAHRIGNADLAQRAMDRAATLVVDDALAHVELSRLAREIGLLEKAEAYARIAVALQPDNAVTQVELARAFVAREKYNAATTVLRNAVRQGFVTAQTIRADSLLSPVSGSIR